MKTKLRQGEGMKSLSSKTFSQLGIAAISSFALFWPASAQTKPRPPVEAFAALPTFANIAISPDGKRLAYGATRSDGNLNIVVHDRVARESSSIDMRDIKLRDIRFEDGGQVLATGSITAEPFGRKMEFYRLIAVNLEKKKSRVLLTEGGIAREYNTGATLVSLLPSAPGFVMMSTYDVGGRNSPATLNLYKVALDSSSVELTVRGTPHTYDWLTDNDGNPIARADLNLNTKVTSIHLKGQGREWREVLKIENTGVAAISLMGYTSTGNVLLRRWNQSEFGELEALNKSTGELSTLVRADGVELASVRINSFSQELLGVRVGGLDPDIRWTNPEMLAAQAQLETQFPDKMVYILDYTPDLKVFVASVETASQPGTLYVLDMNIRSLSVIGPEMPSLDNVALGAVRATTFKSRDNVDIPVYVTTPPGHTNARNAPTIIFPHGGPAARDTPNFDWWAQFMASRGYVVIQPQFRGSTGFGTAFEEAGVRQWGKRMQNDVSDAVAWAVKEGMTDAARTCIIGASYGGYAALAGATMRPELYRCAVSVAGVSDLPQMMTEERRDVNGEKASSVNYWAAHIGSDDRAAMEAASPRRLASSVRAPILLIHGKDDSVVKFNQSQIMASALRAAGKPHKLVQLSGEDHWLSRAATRLQMLREIDAFLAENLGPGLE